MDIFVWCVHIHMWKPEINARYLPLLLATFYFKLETPTVNSANPEPRTGKAPPNELMRSPPSGQSKEHATRGP